eukprot:GHVU01047073.1.p1 GENE.GHVU01047073.1~~GHVU01047073.1.p1  ORF type:complete len:540 (-),score=106.69 GHVU01047073.1:129-1748(-)
MLSPSQGDRRSPRRGGGVSDALSYSEQQSDAMSASAASPAHSQHTLSHSTHGGWNGGGAIGKGSRFNFESIGHNEAMRPRDGATVTGLNGAAFMFGGMSCSDYLNESYVYSPESRKWNPIPPTTAQSRVPEGRAYHAAFAVEDGIVIFGGLRRSGALNDAWKWRLNHWEDLTSSVMRESPRPDPRWKCGIVVIDEVLLVLGGFKNDVISKFDRTHVCCSEIWCLDLRESNKSRLWVKVDVRGDEMGRRANACTTMWNDNIYVYGGAFKGLSGAHLLWRGSSFNPEGVMRGETLSTIGEGPGLREGMTSCVVGGNGWLLAGGRDPNHPRTYNNDLYELSLPTLTFSKVQSLNVPLPRLFDAACGEIASPTTLYDSITILGGSTGGQFPNEIYQLRVLNAAAAHGANCSSSANGSQPSEAGPHCSSCHNRGKGFDSSRVIGSLEKEAASLQRKVVELQSVVESFRNKVSDDPDASRAAADASKSYNCCVCLEADLQAALEPCGHVCVCASCAHRIHELRQKCPICRTSVSSVVRVQLPKSE